VCNHNEEQQVVSEIAMRIVLYGNAVSGVKPIILCEALFSCVMMETFVLDCRDTTVQTLTLQPTVRDGIVVYEDSPLVQAVKYGHVLIVDEADKAPTHVTCILKVSELCSET
jgi:hypothetical protein